MGIDKGDKGDYNVGIGDKAEAKPERSGAGMWKKTKEFLKRQGILSCTAFVVAAIALIKVLLFK